jgi:hypothetical protein
LQLEVTAPGRLAKRLNVAVAEQQKDGETAEPGNGPFVLVELQPAKTKTI